MPMETTELADLQELLSPLTDSNRRPPPYHGGSGKGSVGTRGSAKRGTKTAQTAAI